jgi:hypothetical protein
VIDKKGLNIMANDNSQAWFKPQVEWYQNKIIGSIAECCATQHFEAIGYTVERTGIEGNAPQLARTLASNSFHSHYSKKMFDSATLIPDLGASRIIKNAENNWETQVFYIECKFRGSVNLTQLETELYKQYAKLIELGIPIVFYLICLNYKHSESDNSREQKGVSLFLNYTNGKHKEKGRDHKWWKVGYNYGFSEMLLYKGMKDGQDFNTSYKQIIEPVLQDMFNFN